MRKKRKNLKGSQQYFAGEDEKGFGSLQQTVHDCQEKWDKFDPHQYRYATAIGKNLVVMVDAGAGTGKTTIAVMRGLELLRTGKVDRIQYVRFPDTRSLRLGFLPGDSKDKEKGFMRPFYEAANECGLTADEVNNLISQEVIELSTDIHLRGRTLPRTFLIVDEAQNGGIPDLKLVLTRITESGFAVVIGHSEQMDTKLPRYGANKWNAFQAYQYHMSKKPFTKVCELYHDYRGPISQWADKIEETLKEIQV